MSRILLITGSVLLDLLMDQQHQDNPSELVE